MRINRRKRGLIAICAMAIVLVLSGNVFATSATSNRTNPYIGEAKAKSVALEHAKLSESDVTFTKTRLDRDDGRMVYDVEFYSGNVEYDYEIDAINGNIIEFERETKKQSTNKSERNSNKSSKSSNRSKSSQQDSTNTTNTANATANNTNTTSQYIGEEKAKSIALADAGLLESEVTKIKVELDREDGIMIYEVEFNKGRVEYEYEINATSGAIIKIDID